MVTDWGTAIVVDPRMLERLRAEHASYARRSRWCGRAAAFLLGSAGVLALTLWGAVQRGVVLAQELEHWRTTATRSNQALATLARSHDTVLTATEQVGTVGEKSWGRRFTVTKYVPRSADYGKFNDGRTATMMKADPKLRIVAVDPKLIPYGSWVWIEDLGWYQAQDCGSAIKGFRLDLLTHSTADAMAFGRQDRFVIVVPNKTA